MIKDPIVEEIRKYRSEHAARYDNDLKKICEALRRKEKTSQKEFIHLGPKLLRSKKQGGSDNTRTLEPFARLKS